ncbi:cytochrome c oxidase subunit 3 [Pacificitalea manganoxidans]|uniref:Cytochrome c oxidase subunit 3 n=1 Tax=Pacificitalea manganoxidans TaxID=1411902 RepID=A0A291M1Z3_9RHOB|nr:cytochrome c oxidase subunit 3 [Pacificitalea manganoxidans]MAQ46710.1 cytochrome c oxidase subunit 3 [Actibacterium sp.]OWU67129.1 cytochrome B562 [Roseovarius sp. 22II1-1F6A]ATI42877.1 cytochrome c oxidase subunit 3 [Pacificitalea manganoxidans]MBF51353.1 cytochrome c oxidase subunit 3 [Actibacterium sp.]MDR6307211.1 cytochrome c oxidase subunit 3 [Pacificitalea manganoxidans]|tara:strand:+ start:663 stop:1454 length:792 start_codon:yes stop_codon:yes gene_type:complete
MAHEKNHDYHIINPSIWPFLASVGAFVMLFGAVMWFQANGPWMFLIGLALVLYVMFAWWSDVVEESAAGDHTPVVRIGLRYGFIMFIMSEVMFFAAWFWSFFKHALYPMETFSEGMWPPPSIETFDPWHLPLINTLILLCSGCAVTWAHHALVHENNRKDLKNGLILAVVLGAIFTFFQAYEYTHAAFGFSGNIYGANFFMATGFHGAHVVIGTIFLFVCWLRALRGDFTPEKHIGFEAAAWYWHFVDVVWLFLFGAIYIWGG